MLNLIAAMIFTAVCAGLMAVWYRRGRTAAGAPENPAPAPADPARSGFLDRWEQMALQAGLPWRRNAYYGLAGAAALLAGIAFATGHINGGMALAILGAAGPYIYVRQMKAKRTALFLRQLPPALFLASSVLRAGGTLLQAVDSIASEMPDPMGAEFRRIQQQMRLQVPAHEAMAQAQERVGVREFAAVVVAARITAEVGGNLAHIFDEISRSIVESQNARRMVQSFTTEGRMSANLIAGLPFAVMGLLHLVSPDYFRPLFETWPGRFVLAACLGTIGLGWITIRRMVDIRMF